MLKQGGIQQLNLLLFITQGQWGVTAAEEEEENKRIREFQDSIPKMCSQLRILTHFYQVSVDRGRSGLFWDGACFQSIGDVAHPCRVSSTQDGVPWGWSPVGSPLPWALLIPPYSWGESQDGDGHWRPRTAHALQSTVARMVQAAWACWRHLSHERSQ